MPFLAPTAYPYASARGTKKKGLCADAASTSPLCNELPFVRVLPSLDLALRSPDRIAGSSADLIMSAVAGVELPRLSSNCENGRG